MARLKGILKIEGTIQDLTFYKTQDGNLVRSKGGVSKERIATDPAFARTRENGAEFGSSASSGKLLRDSLRTMISGNSDNRVTSRITQLMTQIKNLDEANARGERSVAEGITKPEAKALLKNFNFNEKSTLASVMFKPVNVDIATGIMTINDFSPISDIKTVAGATHVSLKGGLALVDFEGGESSFSESNLENVALNSASATVTLTPESVPAGSGTKLFVFQLSYFQEVNGVQYPIGNGTTNALAIIEIV